MKYVRKKYVICFSNSSGNTGLGAYSNIVKKIVYYIINFYLQSIFIHILKTLNYPV